MSRPTSYGADGPATDPNTVLVHLRRGASSASATDAASDAGVQSSRFISSVGVAVVDTTGRRSSEVSAALRADPRVELVEPNRMRYASGDPNDPLFFDQTHLFNSRLPAAWDVTHGNSSTVIAVLDSGVDLNHPDLVARIVAGRDIVNNDANPTDDNGHGSAVAGIAAADSDNNVGVAGSAWDAKIMPVKVLGADGGGTDADIAAGIEWAVDAGAKIINMSLGGPGSSQTLANAVNYATANGVLMIAASGNESTDVPSFPAAYDAVVAVGAADRYGDVVAFSNRGPHLDVVAQGVGIVTTAMETLPGEGDDYVSIAGTSAAAPIVSGVAALVTAKNPSFTPAQIASKLASTAIDRGPSGIDDHYGSGLLDAYAAVGGKTAGSPPQAVRDAEEPNDTASSAGPIGEEQTSTLTPEGDIDWFYVDAPQAGTITVTVSPPAEDDGEGTQTVDPVISAWSPSFGSMGSFDSAGAGTSEVAIVQVAAAGRYRFRVSNYSSSRSTGTLPAPDPYSVSSVFVPAAVEETVGELLWVKDASPAAFSRNASASVSPTVTFARVVSEASAESSSNVKLIDAKTGSAVSASRVYDAGTKTVTVDPAASLVVGRSYVINVTGVTDGASTMSETFTSRFTVTPPTFPNDLAADFNKDGFEDVAIGVPGEDVNGRVDGGVVHVLYGSASGPSGSGSQIWHQNSG
ncbi:MAG: S8 family peptidase, partial [Actinomycetota bacterium]